LHPFRAQPYIEIPQPLKHLEEDKPAVDSDSKGSWNISFSKVDIPLSGQFSREHAWNRDASKPKSVAYSWATVVSVAERMFFDLQGGVDLFLKNSFFPPLA
jgi:hypothetical protein